MLTAGLPNAFFCLGKFLLPTFFCLKLIGFEATLGKTHNRYPKVSGRVILKISKILIHILYLLLPNPQINFSSLDTTVVEYFIQHNQPFLTLIIVFPNPTTERLSQTMGFYPVGILHYTILFDEFL
jgi:hypothetical protein